MDRQKGGLRAEGAQTRAKSGRLMLLSYNWLRELLPALDASADEVAERLTSIGLELEEVRQVGAGLDSVRIVAVERVEPHPNRDKLQLVTVTDNKRSQTVVCGANNVPGIGGLVVLAPLGTYLPAVDLELSPRKLGGVVSEGMLCSEEELGLDAAAEGILTFASGAYEPGTPFYSAFPRARDTVFGIGVTPNRPDALGHRGVARDLAVAFGIRSSLDEVPPTLRTGARTSAVNARTAAASLEQHVSVVNQAPAACPRYGAAVVTGVKVGRSPEWVRWRLHALGLRSISNVVDVTNLVLLEYGNPMHAFDLERISGKAVYVRMAYEGERMLTLDGLARDLVTSDLVIADATKPCALAGVMGGAESEIHDGTQAILLEAAYFTPGGIRRTARRLGMQSDSSYRFERGVNWSALEHVLERAVDLLESIAGGSYVGHAFFDGAAPDLPTITLRSQRLDQLLGVAVPFEEACSLLSSLGFDKITERPGEAQFRAAPWRPDVTIEQDLIEEVARIRGLDKIPARLPMIQPRPPTTSGRIERTTRQVAAQLGLSEAVCYSFVAASDLARLRAPEPTVRLMHPLSEERAVMTTSLLPGLLEACRRALRRGQTDVRLFTVAARFLGLREQIGTGAGQAARPVADTDIGALPEERLSFAAVLGGKRPSYLSSGEALDVFDAKGTAEELVYRLTGRTLTVTAVGGADGELPHLHPRGRAFLRCDGVHIGHIGPLHPDVADDFDLEQGLQVIEIDLESLENLGSLRKRYRPVPRLPAVTRDVAVEAPLSLPAGELMAILEESGGALCESVELFDVFTGQGIGENRRSLAFRLVYRDPKASTHPDEAKTLTDKQVDQQHQRVLEAIEQAGASIRA